MKKSVRILNSGTTTLERILKMRKLFKDRGGLGFKGGNLGNNVLKEETQKAKDRHHRRKTYFPALKCYYYKKKETYQEGVLSLLDVSRDEATCAAPKDKAGMDNKNG